MQEQVLGQRLGRKSRSDQIIVNLTTHSREWFAWKTSSEEVDRVSKLDSPVVAKSRYPCNRQRASKKTKVLLF
jgi:hypothetical protein